MLQPQRSARRRRTFAASLGIPDEAPSAASAPAGDRALLITGNPNVGKSVLFHLLTGRYATVSNFPGTTVMVSRAAASFGGRTVRVCDTPGLNSLMASSEDELVAREQLLGGCAAAVQVGDAKNLLRALTLTLELAEAQVPMALCLNMIDEARERRVTIDTERLSRLLSIPVVPTIATQRWGVDRLRRAIPRARIARIGVRYPNVIDTAAHAVECLLPDTVAGRRALALLWLAGDRGVTEQLTRRMPASIVQELVRVRALAQEQFSTTLGVVISQARLRQAQGLVQQVVTAEPARRRPALQRWGDLAMHRWWGLPILAGVLGAMYLLVGDVAAQHGVTFFEEVVFGRYVTPLLRAIIHAAVPWAWLQALFIGEYGLFTMALPYAFAIILPIVGMFFLCFGFLEDVGYLPRLAIMANRFCRLLGLNGKAVLPLVLGLGCGSMATMTARILDSKRDRVLVTLLIALGVPCSAQLGVIMAMLAGRPLAIAIWLGVILAVLVVVGQIAARLLPGDPSPFLYEIPPLRWPKLSNVLIKTLSRVEWYVKEAVPLFFLGTLMLFVLEAAGALAVIERVGSPLVVSWLGLPAKATEAFLVGFLRRDFGAAGLYALQRGGLLSGVQTVVSLVTITLFVPCIAQYFMMVKERGWKVACAIAGVSFTCAFLVGGLVFRALTALKVGG